MPVNEALLVPTIVPVAEITDSQLAACVASRRYETQPFVLHRPDSVNEHDSAALTQLTAERLTTIKAADPHLATDFEPFIFAPSKFAENRAAADVGFHYDKLDTLVAHITLAGSCTASFLADSGTPYRGPRTLAVSSVERPYHIEQAWSEGLVNPSVTDDKVYRTTATIGTMILFLTHRFVKPYNLPQGFWHEFRSNTEDRQSESTLFARTLPHS